jgi:hypothetical protein
MMSEEVLTADMLIVRVYSLAIRRDGAVLTHKVRCGCASIRPPFEV